MNSEKKTGHRLNQVEAALAYLQNDFDQLNEAVLENTKRLEHLNLAVDQIRRRLDSSDQGPSGARNAEDEKPPHY